MSDSAAAPSLPSSNDVVVARGVEHVYKGGVRALSNIDLEIGTGLFGLLGPNGAGKSTLMRILCTLLEPTAGEVSLCGVDVVRDRDRARSLFGYLPQEFGAWRLFRVGEVLDTLALLSGMRDKAQRKERIAAVLEQVGLSAVIDRKVKKLSGGMLRRLGVAQALVHQPRVLVVDEPTVGLDPEERLRFRRLMSELGRDHTIILSTHIIADLGSGCSDIALLDAGELVYRGTLDALVEKARGSVFEVTVGVGREDTLGTEVEIVSRVRDGVGIKLRGVGRPEAIPSSAELVDDPTLEEAYLAFMASRGRAAAVGPAEVQA